MKHRFPAKKSPPLRTLSAHPAALHGGRCGNLGALPYAHAESVTHYMNTNAIGGGSTDLRVHHHRRYGGSARCPMTGGILATC